MRFSPYLNEENCILKLKWKVYVEEFSRELA